MSKPFIGGAVIVGHGFVKIAYFFFKHTVQPILLSNFNGFLCFAQK
jgi:hypothetical protein